MQSGELQGQFDILFFQPDKDQKAIFAKGDHWLETQLYENLKWIECDSILRDLTTNVCDGMKLRLAVMSKPAI